MRFRESDVRHDMREEAGFGRGDLTHLPTGVHVKYHWQNKVEQRERFTQAWDEFKAKVLEQLGSPKVASR